jgi:hypothetical protein
LSHSRNALGAALLTAGLLAAGCGGDDKSDTLAKADLAKKVDAICVKYNAKVNALAEPADIAGYGPYLDKLLPFSTAQREELDALKPDDAVKAEWEGNLKDYDAQQQGLKDARAALKQGDEAEFQRIVEDLAPLGEASDKKLDAFGAPHCGSKSDEAA